MHPIDPISSELREAGTSGSHSRADWNPNLTLNLALDPLPNLNPTLTLDLLPVSSGRSGAAARRERKSKMKIKIRKRTKSKSRIKIKMIKIEPR